MVVWRADARMMGWFACLCVLITAGCAWMQDNLLFQIVDNRLEIGVAGISGRKDIQVTATDAGGATVTVNLTLFEGARVLFVLFVFVYLFDVLRCADQSVCACACVCADTENVAPSAMVATALSVPLRITTSGISGLRDTVMAGCAQCGCVVFLVHLYWLL